MDNTGWRWPEVSCTSPTLCMVLSLLLPTTKSALAPERHGGLWLAKSSHATTFSCSYLCSWGLAPPLGEQLTTCRNKLRPSVPRQDSCRVWFFHAVNSVIPWLREKPLWQFWGMTQCVSTVLPLRGEGRFWTWLCKTSWPVKCLQGHAATISVGPALYVFCSLGAQPSWWTGSVPSEGAIWDFSGRCSASNTTYMWRDCSLRGCLQASITQPQPWEADPGSFPKGCGVKSALYLNMLKP